MKFINIQSRIDTMSMNMSQQARMQPKIDFQNLILKFDPKTNDISLLVVKKLLS